MAASITLAGEKLIAQKQAANLPLTVARFVLANVPGLNVSGPVDRAGVKPPAAQIVYTANISQQGYVNPNQVVYSLLMGTDIGDFDWNWIGMETSDDVLLSVAYVPLQQKRKNVLPDQIGNNVTRNFLVVFDGAQQLTGIKIDASTWQHDFTVRLKGIDERERLSNRDVFGRACFFDSGLKLEKVGSTYQLKAGWLMSKEFAWSRQLSCRSSCRRCPLRPGWMCLCSAITAMWWVRSKWCLAWARWITTTVPGHAITWCRWPTCPPHR